MAEPSEPTPASEPARKVVALCGDLFFTSRIESATRALGFDFSAARTVEELGVRLAGSSGALVLVDLSTRGLSVSDAVDVARANRASFILAVGPHVDTRGRADALAAGCDRWVPNSRLFAEFPRLLA